MAIKYYGQYVVTDTETELLGLTPQAGQIGYPMDSKIRLLYTGSAWSVNASLTVLRGQATVNALSTGATLIYTMPGTSFRFVPIGAHVEVISSTGTGIIAPSISVGTNATNYNNLYTSTSLAALLNAVIGTTQPSAFTPATTITPLTSTNTVYAKVNVAATGYSIYTLRIDLLGYYEV